jgi:hypothetical protein
MARRSNHYDAAFERLLRLIRRPYVAVDETRRALLRESSLKSMDFIVYSPGKTNLLIDVKGRRFLHGRRVWDNWAMQEDISSLMQWQEVFGHGFRSLLVFAYDLDSGEDRGAHAVTWELRGRWYAFYGIWAEEYAEVMKTRSPSWETVCLPAREFRRLRQPLLNLL